MQYLLCFILIFSQLVYAQEELGEPITKGGIVDETGVFTSYPQERKNLEAKIKAFESKHHLPIFIVLEASTKDSSNLQIKANKAREHYLQNQYDGIVLFYEYDTGLFSLSSKPVNHIINEENVAEHIIPWQDDTILRNKWAKKIIDNATPEMFDASNTKFDPRKSCEKIFTYWTDLLDEYFTKADKHEDENRNNSLTTKYLCIFSILIFIAALLFLVTRKMQSKFAKEITISYHFPRLTINRRLGANISGGKCVFCGGVNQSNRFIQ